MEMVLMPLDRRRLVVVHASSTLSLRHQILPLQNVEPEFENAVTFEVRRL